MSEAAGATHIRVMIVDDNRDAADTLAMLLEADGAEARAVYDGETALAVLPNRGLAEQFLAALSETRGLEVLADLKTYPPAQTLDIRIRQLRPDMVLNVSSMWPSLPPTNANKYAGLGHGSCQTA